jgi:hypothetical protein
LLATQDVLQEEQLIVMIVSKKKHLLYIASDFACTANAKIYKVWRQQFIAR